MSDAMWVSTTELVAARRVVDAAEVKRLEVRTLLVNKSTALLKAAAVPAIDFKSLGAKAMINASLGRPSPGSVSRFVIGKKRASGESIARDLAKILRHRATPRLPQLDWANAGILVEEMFPEAKSHPSAKYLSDYYVITVNVPVSSLDASPHDVAYALRSQLGCFYARANVTGQSVIRGIRGPGGDPGPPPPQPPGPPAPSTPADHAWSLRKMNVINAWAMFPNGRSGAGAGILIGHPDTGWVPHFDVQGDDVAPNGNGEINVALGWNTCDPQFPPFTNRHDAHDPLRGFLGLWKGHGTTGVSVAVSRGGVTNAAAGGTDPDPASPGGFRVAGVAPAAKMVPVRCTDSVALVALFDLDIERAVSYAAFNAQVDIISMSLGCIGLSTTFAALLALVLNANIVFVAASGQISGQFEPLPFGLSIPMPAAFPGVLAVTGTTLGDGHAGFSGPKIGIAAPAQGIWEDAFDSTPRPIREWLPDFATSFATTQMAGMAALWLSFHGKAALRTRYQHTKLSSVFASLMPVSAVPPVVWDISNWGPGVIDAVKLLEAPLPVDTAIRRDQPVLPQSLGLQVLVHLFKNLSVSELLARFSMLFHEPATTTEALLDAFADELIVLFGTVPELMQTFGDASLFAIESSPDAIAAVIDRAHSIVFTHGSKTLQAAMTQGAAVIAHFDDAVAHEKP